MYNAHWIHSLPYSKFIELTFIKKYLCMFIPSGRVEIKWNRMNICRISIAAEPVWGIGTDFIK